MNLKKLILAWLRMVRLPIMFLCGIACAQPPNFSFPYLQTTSTGYIVELNEYACPAFGDWDADGDPDLMIGLLYYGFIYYYENISTGIEPQFAPHQLVYADGSPISVEFG